MPCPVRWGGMGGRNAQHDGPAAQRDGLGARWNRWLPMWPECPASRWAGKMSPGPVVRGRRFRVGGGAGAGCGGGEALIGRLARPALVPGQDPDTRLDGPDAVETRPFTGSNSHTFQDTQQRDPAILTNYLVGYSLFPTKLVYTTRAKGKNGHEGTARALRSFPQARRHSTFIYRHTHTFPPRSCVPQRGAL